VLASGATAIAGFGTLIVSDIQMLQDFGIVTVVDLTVSLLGVMVVLPAALVWAEEHGRFTLEDFDPRRLGWAIRDYLDDAFDGLQWRPPELRRPRPTLTRLGGLRLGRRRSRA
jgi:uncharacterized membrane protein YdfJ with MMPL/SSD domain